MRALLTFLLLCSAGCKSQNAHMAAISGFDAGDSSLALRHLNEAADARRAEVDIIQLDTSVVSLMNGRPDQAEGILRATRKQIDFLTQKDAREHAVAVLSDDKAVAWSGREFERRMVDNLLVLTNVVHNGHDAYAYSQQAIEVAHADLDDLKPASQAHGGHGDEVVTVAASAGVGGAGATAATTSPPPARFAPNALATYLYAAMQSEIPTNADRTDRAIQQIIYWQTASRSVPNPSAVRSNVASGEPLRAFVNHTEQGHGVLHVIKLVGRVTPWDEERAEPTSAALLIADRILSVTGKHTLPPTIAPVKIATPRQRFSTHPFRTVLSVESAGAEGDYVSQSLVDLNQSAWDSYQADRDQQLARAVARRIVKKAAVYAAKDQLSVSRNTGVDLLLNLGGIAWEALEKADTRHWTLLPERVEVIQTELRAGEHTIGLTTTASRATTGSGAQSVTLPVRIDDGRNTFVVCFRPAAGFAGRILVGGTEQRSVAVEAASAQ